MNWGPTVWSCTLTDVGALETESCKEELLVQEEESHWWV